MAETKICKVGKCANFLDRICPIQRIGTRFDPNRARLSGVGARF